MVTKILRPAIKQPGHMNVRAVLCRFTVCEIYLQQVPCWPSSKEAHSVAPQVATSVPMQPTLMVFREQYCLSVQWWVQLVTVHSMLGLAFLSTDMDRFLLFGSAPSMRENSGDYAADFWTSREIF